MCQKEKNAITKARLSKRASLIVWKVQGHTTLILWKVQWQVIQHEIVAGTWSMDLKIFYSGF